jgi:hypothetical protein
VSELNVLTPSPDLEVGRVNMNFEIASRLLLPYLARKQLAIRGRPRELTWGGDGLTCSESCRFRTVMPDLQPSFVSIGKVVACLAIQDRFIGGFADRLMLGFSFQNNALRFDDLDCSKFAQS